MVLLLRLHYVLWKYCVHIFLPKSEMERRRKVSYKRDLVEKDANVEDALPYHAAILLLIFSLFLFLFLVVAIVLALSTGADPDPDKPPRDAGAPADGSSAQEELLMGLPDMLQVAKWGGAGRGVAVDVAKLSPEHLEEYRLGYKNFRFNKYLSDRISLRRDLPDVRPSGCKQASDPPEQPMLQASVIVVFHNEPWTLLLRTVYSIVDRSSPALLKEVILVDDGSTVVWLQAPVLERYLSVLSKVRVLRLQAHVGLARARMQAVAVMSGDVAVFLHAGCECSQDWLPPLLARIQENGSTLAVPVVDRIDEDTFQYTAEQLSETTVGSLTWDLRTVRRRVKEVPKSVNERVSCPVIADGIFAVHRRMFLELGGYDEKLSGVDTGHIDLSLRSWLCDGPIELVLCSHVGYLKAKPRSPTEEELEKSYSADRRLVAEKWMVEYKTFVLERLPELPVEPERTQQDMYSAGSKCHNFAWFLRSLEPRLMLEGVIVKRGKLTSMAINETVHLVAVRDSKAVLLEWYVRPATIWYLMESGQLKTVENLCLVAKFMRKQDVVKRILPESGGPRSTSRPAATMQPPFESLEKKADLDSADPHAVPGDGGGERSDTRKLLSYFKDLQPVGEGEDVVAPSSIEVSDSRYDGGENLSFLDEYLREKIAERLDLSGPSYLRERIAERLDLSGPPLSPRTKMIQVDDRPKKGPSLLTTLSDSKGRSDQNVSEERFAGSVPVVKLESCHSRLVKRNHWSVTKTGSLRHVRFNLCLSVSIEVPYKLQLQKCDELDPRQIWHFIGLNLTI